MVVGEVEVVLRSMKEPENNPYIRQPDLDFKDIEDIGKTEAEKEVKLLREAIEYHDYRYYVKNSPVISDKAYDTLFKRLERLENEFELKDDTSPTQKIGGEPLDKLETREHVEEMLSLDASEEEEEVRDFDKRVRKKVSDVNYHVEPKFDGLSVEFVYENGKLEAAVTRGNGVEGDNITENIKTVSSVPLKLHDAPDFLVLRGEIYMPRDGFQKLNEKRVEKGKDAFANPRNAAAGTVRQLDPSVVASRPLDVFFYDIMNVSEDIDSQKETMELLEKLGLKVNKFNKLVSSINDFIAYRNDLMDRREDLNYDIDGVVAKVNDFSKREILGSTASHPRWAFAYKFPAKTGKTTVESITVQVGRTGKLTPVALLDPIDVKGVTISKASLHNEKQAKKLGISTGAKVKVERAGDVIPQIKEVVEEGDGESFEIPKKCPVCGSKVVGEEEHHFCTGGISCPAQLKRKLEYFSSEEAMDIEGLGEKVANELVDKELVERIPDLYKLNKDKLLKLERFADKSAKNLLKEIEKSKDTDLASFITALGILHVGKETARELAREYSLKELQDASREDLQSIDDIGPKMSENIVSFFEGSGSELVEDLLDLGVNPQRKEVSTELENLKLVITGNIEGFSRKELTEILEIHGADVTSTVSSKTDYLIIGDNPGEKKQAKAEEENIDKLSEQEFREKLLSKIEK